MNWTSGHFIAGPHTHTHLWQTHTVDWHSLSVFTKFSVQWKKKKKKLKKTLWLLLLKVSTSNNCLLLRLLIIINNDCFWFWLVKKKITVVLRITRIRSLLIPQWGNSQQQQQCCLKRTRCGFYSGRDFLQLLQLLPCWKKFKSINMVKIKNKK